MKREINVLPSDAKIQMHKDNPKIPEGYYLISITHYDRMIKNLIDCEQILLEK